MNCAYTTDDYSIRIRISFKLKCVELVPGVIWKYVFHFIMSFVSTSIFIFSFDRINYSSLCLSVQLFGFLKLNTCTHTYPRNRLEGNLVLFGACVAALYYFNVELTIGNGAC